jgi:hypothetical protein
MVWSYSTSLRAVLALKVSRFDGHPDVMRDLRRGIQIPEGIADPHQAQAEFLQRFVEGSRQRFAALSSREPSREYGESITQPLSLMRMLPPDTQEQTGMTPTHWE